MIERACPDPYLELFGRSPVDGWTVWGNEVAWRLWTDPSNANFSVAWLATKL